jgi:hypothetical protein
MWIKIKQIDDKIQELQKKKEYLIDKTQLKCKHPQEYIREVDAQNEHNNYYYTSSFRICLKCGYAEEGEKAKDGYKMGYWKLNCKSVKKAKFISVKDKILKFYSQIQLYINRVRDKK